MIPTYRNTISDKKVLLIRREISTYDVYHIKHIFSAYANITKASYTENNKCKTQYYHRFCHGFPVVNKFSAFVRLSIAVFVSS